MSFGSRIALASISICFASSAFADLVTYEFSGTASGTLGSTPFTNAAVLETAIGNTANIVVVSNGSVSAFAVPVSATIAIAGLGTIAVTDASEMLAVPTPVVIATGFPDLPYVILGTEDNPPALGSLTGYGALGSNALLGYNLTSAFGPLTGSPGGIGYPTGLIIHTSGGNLSFTTNVTPTNQGTFTAITPEPGSFLLLSSGLALLVYGVRRASKA